MTHHVSDLDGLSPKDPLGLYSRLRLKDKMRHQWRKRCSEDFGVVDLVKIIEWTREGILLVQGNDADKRNAILRRMYAPGGALRWKKGGFIFANLIRAMQLEDTFDAQKIKTRILLLSDLAECDDIADVLPVLPNGVVTILVYDEEAPKAITTSAFAKVLKSMREQLMTMYSSKVEDDVPEDFVRGTAFQKRRWTIPMVFEESFAYECQRELHPHLWRAVFATVLMNKTPIVDECLLQPPMEEFLSHQTHKLISLCDTILLDYDDVFERLEHAKPFTELLHKEEFAESFQTPLEVREAKGWQKPYTSIFAHKGVYLMVRPKSKD